MVFQRIAYDFEKKRHGPESRTIDPSVCDSGTVLTQ